MVPEFEEWDKIRQRLSALWQREIIERCCIAAFANKETVSLPETKTERIKFWTDGEYVLGKNLARINNT